MTDIHSCSYYCDRPGCIKAQRDEMRDAMTDVSCHHPCTWPDCTVTDQKPVAWVDVKDGDQGPYEFHGMEKLPDGRHYLYAAPPAQPAERVVNADYRAMWLEQVNLNQRLCAQLAAQPEPAQQEPAQRLSDDHLAKALRRAYSLGMVYWQQADSDFESDHRKSDATEAKFKELMVETIAAAQKAKP